MKTIAPITRIKLVLSLVLAAALVNPAVANPTLLAEDIGVTWGMEWINDAEIIVTVRGGDIKLLNIESGQARQIKGAPEVWSKGQGGLFDVAANGSYQPGDWLYFSYAKPTDLGAATTLAKAKLADDKLVQWQDLLVTQSDSSIKRHFGGRLAISDDFIFLSIGDRGHRPNAQDLTSHAGKILRLNLDGSAPQDNPFVDQAEALNEIWSYGHRNPQGLCFDGSKNFWENEHGPRGGDEINLIKPGKNYGWPIVSYGKEYSVPIAVGEAKEKPGMESPKKVYIPSIAPGGLLCYQNTQTDWSSSLFSTALKLRHLNQVTIDDSNELINENRLLEKNNFRIRTLIEDAKGDIIFALDNGQIYRLKPE